MRPFCSRLTCFCLTALFSFAAASPAGEELMPLAPGNHPDSLAGTGTASRLREDADAQARPAVKVNVVKLTLPALVKQGPAAKSLRVESSIPEPAAPGAAPARLTAAGSPSLTPPPRGIVAPAPATFSPIDYMAEIPGLITPEVIATGVPARAFMATTYSASRDDLLDLVHGADAFAPESLSVSPSLPAMPSRRDDRISTLESFAFEPAPRKPRPERIDLPPPIASEAGFGFPGFIDSPPTKSAAAAQVPAHPASAPAPAVRAAPHKPIGPVRPGSLRPPPARSVQPAAAPQVEPLGPALKASPLLSAPLGLSLTASMPIAPMPGPSAGRGRRQPGFTDLPPPASRAARSAPAKAPPRAAPPRKAPSLNERTTPAVDPDDEGFTMMRDVRNLLGP